MFGQPLHSIFEWTTGVKAQPNSIRLSSAKASAPCLFGWGRPGRIRARLLKYTQKSLAELIANTHALHTGVGLHTGRKDAPLFLAGSLFFFLSSTQSSFAVFDDGKTGARGERERVDLGNPQLLGWNP